ncbi:MAG: hypothetical protein AMXMBFR84_19810 [Candidatus Hydrogenedentota bacterium]
MVDRAQIPHLIRLLDDESPAVRERIEQELLAFGDELEHELEAVYESVTPEQRRLLQAILVKRHEDDAREKAWRQWLLDPQLEAGLELMAWYQYGWKPPVSLGDLLDPLAEEYLGTRSARDPISLSRFLFVSKQFRGNHDDYYQPLNSNMIHVLQDKQGLPISLCCLFMLVGQRVGVQVQGVDAPGHFLARSEMNSIPLYFDCFDSGRLLTTREMDTLRQNLPHGSADRLMTEPASTTAIMRRFLRNLIHSYDRLQDEVQAAVFKRLLIEIAPEVTA